jgi:hypothetical protein
MRQFYCEEFALEYVEFLLRRQLHPSLSHYIVRLYDVHFQLNANSLKDMHFTMPVLQLSLLKCHFVCGTLANNL